MHGYPKYGNVVTITEQIGKRMESCRLNVSSAFFHDMARKLEESPGEVVMVIRRPGGKVLLNTKEFYPQGVFRLPSGQIKPGEDAVAALRREALEETGLQVHLDRELGVIRCTLVSEGDSIVYPSYVLFTCETTGRPVPLDASESITGYRELDPCELGFIADRLARLAGPWHDWGCFRAIAHELVHRELCAEAASAR